MKSLITGGAGFIGSHLADALLRKGDEVSILDDFSTGSRRNILNGFLESDCKVVEGSIVDRELMSDLVRDTDVVFHLAAMVGVELVMNDPRKTLEVNIMGTHNVVQLASRFGKKLLIASTSEVYGKNTSVPFREMDDRTLGPVFETRWNYAASKIIDELLSYTYHKVEGLQVVMFRLFNTIGIRQSGQYGMVVPRFVDQALSGDPVTVYGNGQQSRCFCDVEDVVRAIILLSEADMAVGDVFNVGSTHEITIEKLAELVMQVVRELDRSAAGNAQQVRFVPYQDVYPAGFKDTHRRVPDISKINEAVGWSPRISLKESIQRIVHSRGQ
jgi:UDP-glucose 4-epimerase